MAEHAQMKPGAEVKYFIAEPLPQNLAWMTEYLHPQVEIIADVKRAIAWKPEKFIVVDCKPIEWRTGFPIEKYIEDSYNDYSFLEPVSILNIDHHADRVNETYNYDVDIVLDPRASSTAEMISKRYSNNHILYAGMATDTGYFKYSYPSRAMETIVKLEVTDDEISKFRDNLEIKMDAKQLKTMFKSDIKYYTVAGKSLVIIQIPSTDEKILISFFNMIRGFDFAAIIQKNGNTSLRTRSNLDLAQIAKKFKGGGHPQASGCVVNNVDKFVKEYMKFIRGGM
jgi:nanoRNase/pAp phosphatase (c-di-AMP/oligoRNAs hydrolase)